MKNANKINALIIGLSANKSVLRFHFMTNLQINDDKFSKIMFGMFKQKTFNMKTNLLAYDYFKWDILYCPSYIIHNGFAFVLYV